jgi:hypothetical protein
MGRIKDYDACSETGLAAGRCQLMAIDKDKSYRVLDLPPANTNRWVARRKAAVILAIRAGVISREEAYERYALSPEELAAWEAAFDRDASAGCGSHPCRFIDMPQSANRQGHVRPMRDIKSARPETARI